MQNNKTKKDPITNQRVLESITTTIPSGLTKNSRYTTNHTFDADNKLLTSEKTITQNGAVSTWQRDYTLSISTTTSPEGRENKTTYNLNTLLPTNIKYANLAPQKYKYDEEGRVTQTKQGKRVKRYSYDSRGNISEIKNVQRKTKTTYEYDTRDRVTKTIYPDGTNVSFDYDKNGNMTRLVTPTPTNHTFAYNGLDQKNSYSSPLGFTTNYRYDKQRRVTEIIRASGKTINNRYTDGELSTTTTPQESTNYSYYCGGRLRSAIKDDEKLEYSYDGILLTNLSQRGQLNQDLSYTYNQDFKVKSFSYADNTTQYNYDKDGLLVNSGEFTITRNSVNGLATKISDGTLNINQTYNQFGEIKTQKSKNYKLTLKRKQGRIASKVETVITKVPKKRGKGTKTKRKTAKYIYKYDKRDRLITVRKNKKIVERYTYDNNGNRATAKVYGKTITASYTLDDNLEVYGDNTYRYDEDGYLTEKTTPEGVTTYEYGTLGELRKVVTPTKTIEYLHNANNQRVVKKVDGEITKKYLWENLTTLLAIYDKDNNLIQRFEYADSRMPISMIYNNQKYYLLYDQVGTLRAVSDKNLSIVKEIVYDTFGNILTETNESFKVPFGFAGGLYDIDTRLTRFGYRDYDAHTGKWTAKDPIGFDGGDSNLYGYVLGDPVNFVDPRGEYGQTILGIVGIYLAWDTIQDWYEYLDNSKKLCEANNKPIENIEDYLKYQENVQKQLKNSITIGKETTNDILKVGIPLGKPIDTIQSGVYEFTK